MDASRFRVGERWGPEHPKVVVTMPAYRAERTLRRTVMDIPPGVADHMILVDDASPDGTVPLAQELGLEVFVHDTNRGYGGNQKTCYTEALKRGADIIVMLHPDYQYDPKAVPLLIAPILAGDADMTFGSRFAGLSDPRAGGMPLYRYVGNRTTTILQNVMLGTRFTEMHSGMRAYTRRCLLSLPFLSYSDDFLFDAQFLVDAVTLGQRIVEVPIPTRYTKESSSISIRRSVRYVVGGLGYCARRTMERGRRGRRFPVTRKRGRMRSLPAGPRQARRCAICGGSEQILLYSANARGPVRHDEFACTTSALGQHDDILVCSSCGIIASAPTISPAEIEAGYQAAVDEAYLHEETARRELFRWVLGVMGGYMVPGRRLLEVGSNIGLFLDEARVAGWEATGIEPSMWAVKEGRRRFGVTLERGTIEELPAEPGSADAVVMLDVLEHLLDPLAALTKIHRVLADEGILVLATVNVEGLHARARRSGWPWFIRSHLFYFSPQTLQELLERARFRMVGWSVVPRSFRLSYLGARAGAALPGLGSLAQAVSRIVDPRIPLGWLGDVVLTVARPT